MYEEIKNMPLKRITYLVLGCFFLIIFIISWADSIEKYIFLPAIKRNYIGFIFLILSFSLFIWASNQAFFEKKKYLLANQFTQNPYCLASNLLIIAISIFAQKASIFWVIMPIILLGNIPFYYHYLFQKPKNKFKFLLKLPANNNQKPTIFYKIIPYIFVFIPWILLYELVIYRGFLPHSIDTYLWFEYDWQVVEWAELFYISAYIYPFFIPLIQKTNQDLRQLTIAGVWLVVIGIFLQLCLPFIATPRPFVAQSFWGELLQWEREKDAPVAALPSYHVAWAFFSAYFYERVYPKFTWFFYAWCIGITLSCMAVGVHSLVDVVTGILLVLLCVNYDDCYEKSKQFHQKVVQKKVYLLWLDNILHLNFLYLQLFLAVFSCIFFFFLETNFWNLWLNINLFLLLLSLFLIIFTYQNSTTFAWDLLHHSLHLPIILLIFTLYFYQIMPAFVLGIFFILKGILLFSYNHSFENEQKIFYKVLPYYHAKAILIILLGVFCTIL